MKALLEVTLYSTLLAALIFLLIFSATKILEYTSSHFKKNGTWVHAYFTNYLWIGVAFVLLGVLLEGNTTSPYVTVLSSLIKSLGIAVIISAVFTFASDSSTFISKIKNLLQEIIVDRTFLQGIDTESKKQALLAMLRPFSNEPVHANIASYYDGYVNTALGISKRQVRTRAHLNERVSLDQEHGKLKAESTFSYRAFPGENGYKEISVAFEDDDGLSFCRLISVTTPQGDTLAETPEVCILQHKGKSQRRYTFSKLHELQKSIYLDVTIDLVEYGEDHWMMVGSDVEMPTEGFSINIFCEEGIVIKEHYLFLENNNYDLQKPSDHELRITSNQWMNPGSGQVIVVALKEHRPRIAITQ
jgi:hypothetical protein